MQMLKRLWPVPTVLVLLVLAVRACAQGIPYDIEPERVRPQARIELPKIQTVPDAVDYFFEPSAAWKPKKGEAYPVVHMRIPKAPYFEKNSSSGPAREYSLYIKMFYPNFSGLADEENKECGIDAMEAAGKFGHCRRQMTVGFGFGFIPPNSEEIQLHNLQSDQEKGYVKPVDHPSKYTGLELAGVQGNDEGRTTFYIGKDVNGKPAYIFRCWESVPSPACETSFRASKSPYIFIRLDFVLALLPQWQEVIAATRNKVDSMIVQTYHLQPKE